jgi:hypothetical protein
MYAGSSRAHDLVDAEIVKDSAGLQGGYDLPGPLAQLVEHRTFNEPDPPASAQERVPDEKTDAYRGRVARKLFAGNFRSRDPHIRGPVFWLPTSLPVLFGAPPG